MECLNPLLKKQEENIRNVLEKLAGDQFKNLSASRAIFIINCFVFVGIPNNSR